ncbi:MAG: hypothetical protein SF052_05910 [Bacteroidia bacterium]|nr:hypothetical protein [Bacteroidia bacterium]
MNRTFWGIIFLSISLISCKDEENICFETYPNGNRKYEVVCDRWSGDYQGEMKVFDEEGHLIQTRFFVDNREEDTTRFFTPEGFVWKTLPMKAGKPEGLMTEFREDKTLYRTIEFRDGLASGAYVLYFPGGKQVFESAYYEEGRMNGLYQRFFEDGTLAVSGEYMMGFKVGKWIRYREDGSQMSVFTLYINQRQGGFGIFKNSGLPYITGEFVNDRIDGEVSFFNDEGAIVRKTMWEDSWITKQNTPSAVKDEISFTTRIRIPVKENEAVYIVGDSAWIQP